MFDFDDEEDAEFYPAAEEPTLEPAVEPTPMESPTVQRLTQDPNRNVVRLDVDVSANPSLKLALYEKRARAVSLFAKVPFFAYLALHEKLPPAVRLGAGLLALWEASQLYRDAARVEETVMEWAQ